MHTWIGHSISYFFLLFQGCQAVKLSIVNTGCGRPNGALKLDVPRANPKECLQRCNKTNVGIQNANCYCGDFATAAVPNFNCAQQCKWEEAGINFACGGHQFSLYSRAGFVKKPKSKGRYLLEPLSGANIKEGMTDQSGCVLMKSDNEFRVENCSRKYSCWCDGDYFKSMEVTHTETNWAQCAQSCLDKYNMFGFTEGRDHCVQIPCDIDRWINAYVYNDCSPNPCQNNGTCTNTDVGFNCSCPPGFKGNTCEQGCFNILDATLVSDSFVQPSNFETYSLSPSSTLHSTLIIDISADQSSSVIARICSQSASSDLCFMSTVNYTASTITNSIHFSVTPTQTGSINLPSSVLASSSATGITIPSPAVLISTVTIYSSSSSTTSSSVSSTKTLTTASTSTSLESAINPTASIGPKSTFKTYSSGPSSTSTPSLTSVFSTVSAASTPTEPVYLSVSITASSSMRSTAMPPAAVPTPTGTIVSSSSITTSSSVTGTSVTPTAVPTPTGIIVLSSSITTSSSVTETSNQSDAVTGWLSEHAVIIFPICGTVVILLVLIIIIICVKMRKMKRKNDELESEIMDTPSNSEFDYQTSFSYSQRPDNLYPSYHSGQYTYKEVPKLSPSQQIYLPRVSIKPAGSFPRRNKGYEDHSM